MPARASAGAICISNLYKCSIVAVATSQCCPIAFVPIAVTIKGVK